MEVVLYPLHVFNHSGVDSVHSLTPTLLWPTPGHQPEHHPPPADLVLHHKRPPAVPQAGVPPTLIETGAEHVVGDVVAEGARGVAGLALVLRHHWQFDVLQEVRGHPQVGGRCRVRGHGGGVTGGGGDVRVGDAPTSNNTQRVRERSRGVILGNAKVKGQMLMIIFLQELLP